MAQDKLPKPVGVQHSLMSVKEYIARNTFPVRPVEVSSSMPAAFRDTSDNSLIRPEKLYPFFEKILCADAPVRIVHLGDSHVRGHVFPVATRKRLEQAWGDFAVLPDSITYRTTALARETGRPGPVYHAMGINGATTANFTTEEKLAEIESLHPDLLILSFGTNESHTRNYKEEEHDWQLDSVVSIMSTRFPNAIIMLTTPPGSYVRQSRRQRVINTKTVRVVNTMLRFAERKELPVWDLYDIAGGRNRACLNWTSGRYMQNDRVHYTHAGYNLQGSLLGEAILKAYNQYVGDRLD